jgi:hypothetical protein
MASYNQDPKGQNRHSIHEPGVRHVGSYQVSGIPYLTTSFLEVESKSGSIQRFSFPTVAKKIIISAEANQILHSTVHRAEGADVLGTDGSADIYISFGDISGFGNNKFNIGDPDLSGTASGYGALASPSGKIAVPSQQAKGHFKRVKFNANAPQEIEINMKTNHVNVHILGSSSAGYAAATGSFTIYAELTSINAGRMFKLEGAGIDD